jgi:hypothetical protein
VLLLLRQLLWKAGGFTPAIATSLEEVSHSRITVPGTPPVVFPLVTDSGAREWLASARTLNDVTSLSSPTPANLPFTVLCASEMFATLLAVVE